VFDLLDGTEAVPEKTLEVEDAEKKKSTVPNPAYTAWVSRDQTVLGWVLQTLSPEVTAHVVGLETSAAVWTVITNMFSASRTRINHLRGLLNNTKKNSLTADQFFAKMKGYASELAATGKPVEEDEMIGYIVNGLDKTYNSLVSSVENPSTTITLDDLFGMVSSHDMRQEMLEDSSHNEVVFHSSANAARRGPEDNRPRGGDCGDRGARGDRGDSPDRDPRGERGYRTDRYNGDRGLRYDDRGPRYDRGQRSDDRGSRYEGRRRDDGWHRDDGARYHGDRHDGGNQVRRRDDGRRRDDRRDDRQDRRRQGRVPTPFVDVTCQICKKYGHPASDCWWHYQDDESDDGGDREDKNANLASYGVDTNWYADSGATHHITSELNKLTTQDKYRGRDCVHTAAGTGMSINHVGHSILCNPDSSIQLKNILHVHKHLKIFFLFINSYVIMMSFLNFTESSF
jgi:hypothetical protein